MNKHHDHHVPESKPGYINSFDPKGQGPIGVIGTGNYATALTKRLVASGYQVYMGSRNPSKRKSALIFAGSCLCGVEVTSVQDCISLCDVIFIAIHMENYKLTLSNFAHLARNKIVVDISNRENRYATISNAQRLADVLPNSSIVKAFNTIAPSTLEISVNRVTSPKVYISGDDKFAKNIVREITQQMGFGAVDFGDLKSALYLEDFVLRVFTRWKIPIFLAVGIFNLWSLYIVYIYFIAAKAYSWEQLFLKVLNKPLCMTAISMMALTYMPGQLAAILQVYRGTKHKQFPRFLDSWLKSRKQLGIITFILILFHVIASTLMLNPTYYKSWFHQPTINLPQNLTLSSNSQLSLPVSTTWMVWKGEVALLFGISAFIVVSILAVTSLPSVAESLNWSEWRCVHSKMGTAFMMLSVGHVTAMGAPGWAKVGFPGTLQSITFLSIILPVFVLTCKFVFQFSPLRCRLAKIRKGWESRDSINSSLESSRDLTLTNAKNRCRIEESCKVNFADVEACVHEVCNSSSSCCSNEEIGLIEQCPSEDVHDSSWDGEKKKCCRCTKQKSCIEHELSDSAVPGSISNSSCHCSSV